MIQQNLVEEVRGPTDKELTAKAYFALSARYAPEHFWHSFREVSLNGRQADFIAFNRLPSRDFQIVGCEVKASRQDWLKELKTCEKADPLIVQCDEWYIVEAREGIVFKEELPSGWGFLRLRKQRLKTIVPSRLKQRGVFSRELLARLVEQTWRGEHGSIDHLLSEAHSRGYEEGLKSQEDGYELRNLRERVKILEELEKEGIDLYAWDLADGKRVKRALCIIELLKEGGIPNKIDCGIQRCEGVTAEFKKLKSVFEEIKTEIEHQLPEEKGT